MNLVRICGSKGELMTDFLSRKYQLCSIYVVFNMWDIFSWGYVGPILVSTGVFRQTGQEIVKTTSVITQNNLIVSS